MKIISIYKTINIVKIFSGLIKIRFIIKRQVIITKNKYSNRHWYENHVSRGDYKFITSRNLIELLKLAKRCSNIEDHYELSCIGYYRAENFHIRLGEIHEETISTYLFNLHINFIVIMVKLP